MTAKDTTANCSQCGVKTSFERSTPGEPQEGEVCSNCNEWFCIECIDWKHMRKVNTVDPICKNCSKEAQ